VYDAGGISPPSTASQISCTWLGESVPPSLHSEKLSFSRPAATCRAISQEAGGNLLYHGHRVAFEWQSAHDRCNTARTSAGIDRCAGIPSGRGAFASAVSALVSPMAVVTSKAIAASQTNFFVMKLPLPA